MTNQLSPAQTERSIDMTTVGSGTSNGILVFSHLRWNFVWQRPQQFLSRFSQRQPVLFFEEPVYDLAAGEDSRIDVGSPTRGISVATPHLSPERRGSDTYGETMRSLLKEALNRVNINGAFDSPLLWYYTPLDATWTLGHMPHRGIVYDCMDELSQFRGAAPELKDAEKTLLDAADVVFTGGYELWMKKSRVHHNVHFFGCGVEEDHFGKAREASTSIPDDVASIPHPILGWFGVIDERVDYKLLKGIATERPDWSIVMVGPVVKVDPSELPQCDNIHWVGGRDYADLPGYCKAFDICMMPFALNEATQYINPTKALEYMATGKPIVSTAVGDVVRQYSDIVYIEQDSRSFVSRIEDILEHPDHARIERGIEKARAGSWDTTVDRMRELIKNAVNTDAGQG